jgi:hypothetical protein
MGESPYPPGHRATLGRALLEMDRIAVRESDVLEDAIAVKAIVSRGQIHPLERLPLDWQEGQQLRVEKADDGETPVEEIDRDFSVLASLCEASELADEEQLERGLREARRQAKGLGRVR